jgi:PST family polysaccharide transporter
MLILGIWRVPISQWALGGPEHEASVALVGLALLFNLVGSMQTSILGAYRRVSALAKVAVLNSFAGATIALTFLWLWREQGIAPGIVGSSAASWMISWYFLRREVTLPRMEHSFRDLAAAAWSLLRFGAPYTASQLVGTGTQLALPLLVFHTLGQDSTGYYRAAIAVASGYLGFLLVAMSQDYYPRVSASKNRPGELVQLVNQQHRLVMLLAVPIILGTLALTPLLVPTIYSPQFTATIGILEWLLIGDIFRFSSWTMGYVILVQSGSTTLFLVELASGLNILVSSWLGMRWFGLEGLGIAFLVTYVFHYLIVSVIVRRDISFVWTYDNKAWLITAVIAALFIRVLPSTYLQEHRIPLALVIAASVAMASLRVIWREVVRVEEASA